MLNEPLPPSIEPPKRRKSLAEYLTLSTIIPCFMISALVMFLLLEIVIPDVRDSTAFIGSPPGSVDQDPVKTPTQVKPFYFRGTHGLYTGKHLYALEPVNDYDITARVLHTRHYYSDKNTADLIPFDIALGWNVMSDVTALRRYFVFHHYNTGGRMLFIQWSAETPQTYVFEASSGIHFSNDHIIPANDAVFRILQQMGAGDIVRLKGQLVNVTRPDEPWFHWITSQHAREDAEKNSSWGDGETTNNLTTCDTMFVTDAEILKTR